MHNDIYLYNTIENNKIPHNVVISAWNKRHIFGTTSKYVHTADTKAWQCAYYT